MKRALILSLLLCASAAWSAPPQVSKVEPPTWWIGLPQPMLLVYGSGLAEADVTTATPGVRVQRAMDGNDGRYLIVYLQIAPTARPGKTTFTVSTKGGKAQFTFALGRRSLAAAGSAPTHNGFDGFDANDVIYCVSEKELSSGLAQLQARISYFKQLGFTAIAIPSPADAADLFSADKRFGSDEELAAFSKALHSAGMKLLLEFNANSVSPLHAWAAVPPTSRWIHGTADKHLSAPDEVAAVADPHASQRETRPILQGWVNGNPDIATEDPSAAEYMQQLGLWWTERLAADGLMESDFAYVDRSFWHDFNEMLRKTYPRIRTIADARSNSPEVTAYFAGGKVTEGTDSGADTVFDYPLDSALESVGHGKSMTGLSSVLAQDWQFPHPLGLVTQVHGKFATVLQLTMRGIPEISSVNLDSGEAQVRNLLRLRAEHPALKLGAQKNVLVDDTIYAFVRQSVPTGSAFGTQPVKGEKLLVVANRAQQQRTIDLDVADTIIDDARKITPLFGEGSAVIDGGKIRVEAPVLGVAVYKVECGCDLD